MKPSPMKHARWIVAIGLTVLCSARPILGAPVTGSDQDKKSTQVVLARTLLRCTELPSCGAPIRKNPCACENQAFPCRMSGDSTGGCSIRFSCTEIDEVRPKALIRGATVMCPGFPEDVLSMTLSAKLPDHVLEPDIRPKTCAEAVDVVVGGLDSHLRARIRALPRTEMVRFVHTWGSNILYVLEGSEANTILYRSCATSDKELLYRRIASMNILDRIWLRLQND